LAKDENLVVFIIFPKKGGNSSIPVALSATLCRPLFVAAGNPILNEIIVHS
jgi:hypothetical protein